MPIIEALLARDIEVVLATNGSAQDYFQSRFPSLELLTPPGYDIRYSAGRAFFNILLQTPRILKTIKAEHNWLADKIRELDLHAVISDNRYGMFGKIPSVIVTHQTSPMGPAALKGKLRRMVNKHLENFHQCWIPDDTNHSLSGELSSTENLAIPYSCVGPLSRLNTSKQKNKGTLLGLVSGPESQRTEFENDLKSFLFATEREAILICGKPKSIETSVDDNLTTHSHLDDQSLSECLQQAEYIFCRSGYSTILDLAKLGLKANLIPTKGQSEQVFLAKLLSENHGWKAFEKTEDLDLTQCVKSHGATPTSEQNDLLELEIDALIRHIQTV